MVVSKHYCDSLKTLSALSVSVWVPIWCFLWWHFFFLFETVLTLPNCLSRIDWEILINSTSGHKFVHTTKIVRRLALSFGLLLEMNRLAAGIDLVKAFYKVQKYTIVVVVVVMQIMFQKRCHHEAIQETNEGRLMNWTNHWHYLICMPIRSHWVWAWGG